MRKGGPRKKRKAEEEIERDSVGGKCACFNFGSVVRLIDGAENGSVPVPVSVLTSVSASVSVSRPLRRRRPCST